MLENSTFNDEWIRLQKSFWNNLDSRFTEIKNLNPKENYNLPIELTSVFEHWLIDVDKCWQDHAQNSSIDTESLYKRLLLSSRFFLNSSMPLVFRQQNKTIDDNITNYISKYIENISKVSEDKISDTNKKNDDFHTDAFLKLPLEFWQQYSELFMSQLTSDRHHQQRSKKPTSNDTEDVSNSPEFSKALDNYLVALNDYRKMFCNLFIITAKTFLESFKSQADTKTSKSLMMTSWLELLELNYAKLISGSEYSQTYANVINSWMLMLSLSKLSFTEFMQSTSSTTSAPNKSELS